MISSKRGKALNCLKHEKGYNRKQNNHIAPVCVCVGVWQLSLDFETADIYSTVYQDSSVH